MCEEILQLYSSQDSSKSLAIKILLSTTGLISTLFIPKTRQGEGSMQPFRLQNKRQGAVMRISFEQSSLHYRLCHQSCYTLSCCVHSKHKEVLFQFLWNTNALPVCKSNRKALKFLLLFQAFEISHA